MWKKIGLIIKPQDFNLKWWKSYGMDPSPIKLRKSVYRVFLWKKYQKSIFDWLF